MITLHDVHKQGSEAVKAAVMAFGARHPLDRTVQPADPNWHLAEQHFTRLIEIIMGAASLRDRAATAVQRAENEAVHFLLSVSDVPGYRCPICVRHQTPVVSPGPTLEAT
ncbi:hypothetical protein ACH4KN_11590 [Streptomyces sp. NPDC017546]|uniref:hypothetical protein n=1 Tax=unclassified Streptomyces TaxID=2593676 RepID=UPI0023615D27|nr:hypothetical protein [Streptomyces sp. MMBL 11-1]